jgi:hypothetical protein
VEVLQVSLVQELLSLQVMATPTQLPFKHASPLVQALLSVQAVPLDLLVTAGHAPAESHKAALVHWVDGVQRNPDEEQLP